MYNSFSDFCELVYLKKSEKSFVSTCFKKPGFSFFFIYINRAKQTKYIFIHNTADTDKENTCAKFLRIIKTVLELKQLNFSFLLSDKRPGLCRTMTICRTSMYRYIYQIIRNVLLNVAEQDIWLGHFFVDKVKIKKNIELNLTETYDHSLWIDQK